jgi:uncharacterized protein (TIGR02145 family)
MIPSLATAADPSSKSETPSERSRYGTVEDVDGNRYRTVEIGAQIWMADNLETTRYRDGSAIPHVVDAATWSDGSIGAYCFPANDRDATPASYGLLYNFAAVNDRRGLCPEGWHVPTATEWRTLVDQLGGADIAGKTMKDVDSGLWSLSTPGADNSSGFSALPAGGRGRFGDAGEVGMYATWWAATSEDDEYAWHWGLYPDRNSIRFNPGHMASGFSVRCVRD